MRTVDIMPADLVDAATPGRIGRSRRTCSYLYVKGAATNTRLWLDEGDRGMVAELVGEGGISFCLLEKQRAAVVKSGGHRRIARTKGGKAYMSVGDMGTKAAVDRMFPDGGSYAASFEPVKLGDGTVAVYVEFGGAL